MLWRLEGPEYTPGGKAEQGIKQMSEAADVVTYRVEERIAKSASTARERNDEPDSTGG